MKQFVVHDAGGAIVRSGSCPDALFELQAQPAQGELLLEGAADPFLHYVAGGQVRRYTDAELAAKRSLAPGVVWKMPERVAHDTRSAAQRDAQEAADTLRARAREYPPIADLADALYWQANKDPKPMADYLAAVGAVKAKYPKKVK